MKIIASEQVTSRGGRSGTIASADGNFRANLVRPKALGGPGGGTNPEQLFGAGYSACFLSAMAHVAQLEKIELSADTTVTATVDLGLRHDGGYALDVALVVHVPEVDRGLAERLMFKAHDVCPYSHAIQGNVDVSLSVA